MTPGDVGIFPHPSGTEWYDAPLPRRFHRCKPWTIGHDHGTIVRRCACGAVNIGHTWIDRNSRRKHGER